MKTLYLNINKLSYKLFGNLIFKDEKNDSFLNTVPSKKIIGERHTDLNTWLQEFKVSSQYTLEYHLNIQNKYGKINNTNFRS